MAFEGPRGVKLFGAVCRAVARDGRLEDDERRVLLEVQRLLRVPREDARAMLLEASKASAPVADRPLDPGPLYDELVAILGDEGALAPEDREILPRLAACLGLEPQEAAARPAGASKSDGAAPSSGGMEEAAPRHLEVPTRLFLAVKLLLGLVVLPGAYVAALFTGHGLLGVVLVAAVGWVVARLRREVVMEPNAATLRSRWLLGARQWEREEARYQDVARVRMRGEHHVHYRSGGRSRPFIRYALVAVLGDGSSLDLSDWMEDRPACVALGRQLAAELGCSFVVDPA